MAAPDKMEAVFRQMNPDGREDAKRYLAANQVPQLFESVTVGLLHHRPANPVEFVQDCLDSARDQRSNPVQWDTFINWTPPSDSRTASRAGDVAFNKTSSSDRKLHNGHGAHCAGAETYPPEVLY